MADQGDPVPLLAVLRDLTAWLLAQRTPSIIIGGVAASVLGRPRVTADVDVSVLVDEIHWSQFLVSGEAHGFAARRNDALDFARQSHVLLMRHGPTSVNVDVVFAALPFEREAIARAQTLVVRDIALPLPTVEDLVIMKAVAHRPRDLTDIEAIVNKHPDLDRRRILRWVRRFAAALDTPVMLQDLQALLKQRGNRP